MSRRALLLLAFLQLLRMRKRRQGEKSDGNVLEALIVPQGLHSLFQWICAYGLCIYLATASIVSIQSFSVLLTCGQYSLLYRIDTKYKLCFNVSSSSLLRTNWWSGYLPVHWWRGAYGPCFICLSMPHPTSPTIRCRLS